jgi:hypothetical protein
MMNNCSWWTGHDWGKWEQSEWHGTVVYTGLLVPKEQRGVRIPVAETRQARVCKKCGYVQKEVIEAKERS